LQFPGDGLLVKDVILGKLNHKSNTERKLGTRLGRPVCIVRREKSTSYTIYRRVWRERCRFDDWIAHTGVGGYCEEMAVLMSERVLVNLDKLVPMKTGDFGSKSTKRRGNGIELNLFDLRLGFWIGGIFMNHVI